MGWELFIHSPIHVYVYVQPTKIKNRPNNNMPNLLPRLHPSMPAKPMRNSTSKN
ncbi:hypothetical protein Scep_001364 [Stephania cephalantha]|uniref:Uncharacterized protein n=1 Tax=Stephania cephalantha TaxID=152367 RepID=A0AAP0L978_9MAGN